MLIEDVFIYEEEKDKKNSIAFEILKLILLAGIGLLFFMMGKQIFSDTHYSSTSIGVSGGLIGLSLF